MHIWACFLLFHVLITTVRFLVARQIMSVELWPGIGFF